MLWGARPRLVIATVQTAERRIRSRDGKGGGVQDECARVLRVHKIHEASSSENI